MDDILSLEIDFGNEPIFPASARDTIFELGDCIKWVEMLNNELDPWYISEGVVDPSAKLKRGFRDGLKETGKTIKTATNIYNDLATAKSYQYSATWAVLTSLLSGITAMMRLIGKLVSWIPGFIVKLTTAVSNIPRTILAKINGDMSLYISAQDIETVYSNQLIKVDAFIEDAQLLARGETWGKLKLKHRSEVKRFGEIVPPNDRKLANDMIKIKYQLEQVKFNKTNINVKDKNNLMMYFGKSLDGEGKKISFNGIKIRDHHKVNYHEALQIMMDKILDQKEKLDKVATLLDLKFDKNKENNVWQSLPQGYKNCISDAFSAFSVVTSFIASLLKYLSADLKEWKNVLEKVNPTNKNADNASTKSKK